MVCVEAHLPPVEILDDGEMQILFPLPLALHGVVEELSERPVGPLQQLVIQQQGVRRLCDTQSGDGTHVGYCVCFYTHTHCIVIPFGIPV